MSLEIMTEEILDGMSILQTSNAMDETHIFVKGPRKLLMEFC